MTLDDIFTPMNKWGKDHWSTLLYIESRIVDHRGILAPAQMRNKHPKYPTRLNDGTEITMHSDWDCLDDMAYAGLLRPTLVDGANLAVEGSGGVRRVANEVEAWALTDYGWQVAGALRKHAAIERRVSTFVAPVKP